MYKKRLLVAATARQRPDDLPGVVDSPGFAAREVVKGAVAVNERFAVLIVIPHDLAVVIHAKREIELAKVGKGVPGLAASTTSKNRQAGHNREHASKLEMILHDISSHL